jgi:hypothetical protein
MIVCIAVHRCRPASTAGSIGQSTRSKKLSLCCVLLSRNSLQQYDRLLYRESGMFSPTDSSISHKSNAKSYISVKDIVFTRTMPEKCYDGSEASDADPVCSKDHGFIDVVSRFYTANTPQVLSSHN